MAMRPAKQMPSRATGVVASSRHQPKVLIYGSRESTPTYIALFAYFIIQNTRVCTQSRSAVDSSRFMNRYLDSIRKKSLMAFEDSALSYTELQVRHNSLLHLVAQHASVTGHSSKLVRYPHKDGTQAQRSASITWRNSRNSTYDSGSRQCEQRAEAVSTS